MPDVREELGRLAGEAGEPGGLDDLAATRRRRERRRRTTSLVGGLAVLIAGIAIAVQLGTGSSAVPSDTGTPAPSQVSPSTVWPENAVNGGSPLEVQAAVDEGDDSLRWRLAPQQVVERFAESVLGRSIRFLADPSADGEAVILRGWPCPPGEQPGGGLTCDTAQGDPLVFRLIQPATAGPGGIWSVASVTSQPLVIEAATGTQVGVPEGTEVEFVVSQLPDATTAHIGIVGSNGCNVLHRSLDDVGARAVVRVPSLFGADPTCAAAPGGYAFVYVTDETTLPSTDPVNDPTAIEYPWLSIVPFSIMNESASFAPTPTPSVSAVAPSTSAPQVDCTSRTDVTVVERGIALTGCQDWAAGEPLRLTFKIEDRGVAEGLELFAADRCSDGTCSGQPVWQGQIDVGRAVVLYDVPTLDAGRYVLRDPVHPTASMQIDVS